MSSVLFVIRSFKSPNLPDLEGDLPGDLPGATALVPEEDLQNQVKPVGPCGPASPRRSPSCFVAFAIFRSPVSSTLFHLFHSDDSWPLPLIF